MTEGTTRIRIGKYEVVKLLGEGAMGVVYLAHDPTLERNVAIKVIRKDLVDRRMAAQMIARFRNEAMAAGRLQHPGIVAVYDYGEDESASYIVMEYAPGEDLDEYGHKYAPLGLPELAALMEQLLDALQYAHAAGVVHRDIKPSNLLIAAGGKLKITDFGIARIATSKLTQTGTAMGTPMYMAPEQYAGAGVDHRADLFAAGVLFYELLTGHKPFAGESIQEVAYKVCYTEPVAPTVINPFLPPALDLCVTRSLAKQKEQRFASAAEMARAIGDAIGTGKLLTSPATLRKTAPAFPPDIMKKLESILTPTVGPLAGTVIRRAMAKTLDRKELLELLSRGAGNEAGSPTLVRDLRAVLESSPGLPPEATSTVAPASGPRVPVPALSPEELDRATQALVGFIGPIAKVLVKKTSGQALDFRDLCTRLAEHLASDRERALFLQKVGGK